MKNLGTVAKGKKSNNPFFSFLPSFVSCHACNIFFRAFYFGVGQWEIDFMIFYAYPSTLTSDLEKVIREEIINACLGYFYHIVS
jgi:hypothetical protein